MTINAAAAAVTFMRPISLRLCFLCHCALNVFLWFLCVCVFFFTTLFSMPPLLLLLMPLQERLFPLWDWVGGRYSVCSSVGALPLSLKYGFRQFENFLAGEEIYLFFLVR